MRIAVMKVVIPIKAKFAAPAFAPSAFKGAYIRLLWK